MEQSEFNYLNRNPNDPILSAIERDILEQTPSSLARGKRARRNAVVYSASFMTFEMLALFTTSLSEAKMVAIVIAISAITLVWCAMTVSASLNLQFDVVSSFLHHLVEREQQDPQSLD